jgi:hypothetical protein
LAALAVLFSRQDQCFRYETIETHARSFLMVIILSIAGVNKTAEVFPNKVYHLASIIVEAFCS